MIGKAPAVLFVSAISWCGAAHAGPPLPPPRPPDLAVEPASGPPVPPPRPRDLGVATPATAPSPPGVSSRQAACLAALAGAGAVARPLAPIMGTGGCAIASPVRLSAIRLADGTRTEVSPPATLRCGLALVLAEWLRDDVEPALKPFRDRIAALDGVGGYECRSRDRIAGAKLSEHAKGDAVDIESVKTAKDGIFPISGASASTPAERDALFQAMKAGACARFSTVLGPGADAFHADNLHLDLEPRRHARICEWTPPA